MGKNKYIETPEKLLQMWEDYKKHVDNTPDTIEKATNLGVQKEHVKRPYLRQGFQAYVYKNYGFHCHQYFDNYEERYNDYLGVTTHVRNEWEDDQISGTLTGRYKAPNLVARLNGLVDKTETDLKGTLNVPNLPDIGNRK